jgi:hypothetical protein
MIELLANTEPHLFLRLYGKGDIQAVANAIEMDTAYGIVEVDRWEDDGGLTLHTTPL